MRPPSPSDALRPSPSSASHLVSLPVTSRVRVSYHHHAHSQTRAQSVAHIFLTAQVRSGLPVKQKPATKTNHIYPAKIEPLHLSSTLNPLPHTPCRHHRLRNLLHTLSTCGQRLHPVREESSGQACRSYFLETRRKMKQSRTPSRTRQAV